MNPLYNRVSLAALLAASAVGPGTAGASGFALLEQSASRLGTAFAGTAAAADDATTLFFNPAGMTLIEGNQLAAGLASGIEITSEFSNAGSTAAFGQPSGGTGGDAGGWNFVPGVYLTTPLTEDVTIGLGINAPFGLKLSPDQWLYLFTLAITVVMFVIGWNLIRGRVGRALVAIRDQPIAASAMGIDTALYKSLAFGVSAMYTGIAGALGAIAIQFVAPDSFGVGLSIGLLTGIVIGGLASIPGAFFGALFIQFIPNVADQISKAAPWAIYGIFLIGFMFLMPMGINGAIRLGWARMRHRHSKPAQREGG